MRAFSASLVLAFFSVASGLAGGQASQAAPDRQAVLEYQLTVTQADHLIAAMTAMTKYLVSLPDFRDRLTDANAGYPSLFFAGVFAAAGLPVFAVAAVFAGKSLARREPHRVAMLAVLAVSILFAWTLVTRIVHIVWSQLT